MTTGGFELPTSCIRLPHVIAFIRNVLFKQIIEIEKHSIYTSLIETDIIAGRIFLSTIFWIIKCLQPGAPNQLSKKVGEGSNWRKKGTWNWYTLTSLTLSHNGWRQKTFAILEAQKRLLQHFSVAFSACCCFRMLLSKRRRKIGEGTLYPISKHREPVSPWFRKKESAS